MLSFPGGVEPTVARMGTLNLTRRIIDCAAGSGVDIVGFASVKGLESLLHQSIREIGSTLPYGISLGYRLSDAVVDNIRIGPTLLYKQHYKTVNWILDQCAVMVVRLIESSGMKALAIPASQTVDWEKQSGHMSHKAIAAAAGLGWIGKSGLLVTEEQGARIRFSSVLTDLPLEAGKPVENGCGDCARCIELCPARAISGSGYDMSKCLEKLKAFARRPGIGVFICGVCVKACPFSQRKAS